MNLKSISPNLRDATISTEIAGIRTGSVVRLQLESGQFFWARTISDRRPNGTFKGTSLDRVPPVKIGDMLIFEPGNVREVL